MESRLMGRDVRSAEITIVNYLKVLKSKSKEIYLRDLKSLRNRGVDAEETKKVMYERNKEIAKGVLKNSGFAHAFNFFVDSTGCPSIGEVCDPFLDDTAYAIRKLLGYGLVNSREMGQLAALTRIISRDNVMRNIITADGVLSYLADFDLNVGLERNLIVILLVGN